MIQTPPYANAADEEKNAYCPSLPRNHNTGNDPATDDRMEVAEQAIHHSAGRPAFVELSVVPGVDIVPR